MHYEERMKNLPRDLDNRSRVVTVLAVFLIAAATAGCQCRGSIDAARALAAADHAKVGLVEAAAGFDVRGFGAVGDGVVDDRAAIQAALDAGRGDVVRFSPGRYLVGRGAGNLCLQVHAGTTLVGAPGAELVQAPGIESSTRLLHVAGDDVTVEGLTLDGNKAAQSANEHRHGLFATASSRLTVRRVVARGFSGDGFYVHIGSHDSTFEDVTATGNDRNGLTLGGGTAGSTIRRGRFGGNRAQQLDSEPGATTTADGVTITDSVLDGAGASGDFALTVSGSGRTSRSRGWTVERNTINGAIHVVWATDVVIRGNRGVNGSDKPSVKVYRSCDRVRILDNDFSSTGPAKAVVEVVGTGAGQVPDHVVVHRNVLSTTRPAAHGIHIAATRDVRVVDNEIRGAGVVSPFMAGVFARSTVPGEDIRVLVVRGNRISDFGAYGVSVSSSPGAVWLVDVSGNVFDDTAGVMLTAMAIDAALDVRQHDNLLVGGVASMLARQVPGTRSAWGTGDRWVAP